MRRRRVHLLIGVTSFVGRFLADYLAKRGEKVVGTFRRPPRGFSLDRRIRLVRCDVTDRRAVEDVVKRVKPDVIYFLAAQSSVREAWHDPVETVEVNLVAGVHLLEILRRSWRKARLLIFSSGTVYGLTHLRGIKLKESAPLAPKDPYGVSKMGLDFFAGLYAKVFGVDAVILRLSNLVGPGQSAVFSLSNFGYQLAGMEKGRLKPVLQVGSIQAKRDYLDVRDSARALALASVKAEPGGVYNIASGTVRTLEDCIDSIIDMSDLKREEIEIVRNPAFISKDEIPAMRLDSSKFRRRTGWRPDIPFAKSLEDILDFWRRHWDER